MATRRVIGVDIGSFAVRAAEVAVSGDVATLVRFGQVTLPVGAVRHGEVVDVGAVSSALRRLWSEAGFKQKRVVVGVANQRAIVRQAEIASMTEQDLRSAITYEAQDLIPIPVDDALLDFRILDRFQTPDGGERMNIVLAAAHRDMVRSHLAALEGAGLLAEAVDAAPFALVRSLADRAPSSPESPPRSEAIVCIGGSVTSIVVHESGVPRFVRVLLSGGSDLTEAVADELNVPMEKAEDLKRRAAVGMGDTQVLQATQVMTNRLAPFVDEIRGSIDFYRGQPDATPLDRVVVTGGGSNMTGLIERLEHQLRTEVVTGRPLAGMKVDELGLTPEQLAMAESVLAVPIGLALPHWAPLDGTRRISLLPGDAAKRNARRRQLLLAGTAVAAVAAALVVLTIGRQGQLVLKNAEVQRTEDQAADVQKKVVALGDMAALESDLKVSQDLVIVALASDVAWTKVISDVSAKMPAETVISTFSGTSTATGGGTVSFSVSGAGFPSAAAWYDSVGQLPQLFALWVPAISKDATTGRVTFTSTAQLTPVAQNDRKATYLPQRTS